MVGVSKGHPEPTDISIREIACKFKEETGLTPTMLGKKEYFDHYLVERNGELKDKTVTYLLVCGNNRRNYRQRKKSSMNIVGCPAILQIIFLHETQQNQRIAKQNTR